MRHCLKSWLPIVLALTGLMAAAAFAEVPRLINYQGELTDAVGDPVSGTKSMAFSICADEAGTLCVWSESQSVTVTEGRFEVKLGINTPLSDVVFEDSVRWLGITVEGEAIEPHVRIVTAPYAFRVSTVDGASGGTVSSDLTVLGKGTIGTGHTNTGANAFAAGNDNVAEGEGVIVEGGHNLASGYYAVVGGGGGPYIERRNTASGDWSTVAGGRQVTASGEFSTISGGAYNFANSAGATVGGGESNSAEADYATVGGGYASHAISMYATICGGQWNNVDGSHAAIVGGRLNSARGTAAFIGGGDHNITNGDYSVVCGGGGATEPDTNSAAGNYSTVGGGTRNSASDEKATVSGGSGNTASGIVSTVSGGGVNTASGYGSTVSGGQANVASGENATVPGGLWNEARGISSVAIGQSAKAGNFGSVVISAGSSSSSADSIVSGGTGQVVLRADGGIFVTDTAGTAPFDDTKLINTSTGAYLSAGGDWTNSSDRNLKENFSPADGSAILDKLSALPISEWNYIAEGETVRHIGPVAQDFKALFGLGGSDKSISTVDPAGIALAAIKELHLKTQEIDELKAEVEQLKAMVERLATQ